MSSQPGVIGFGDGGRSPEPKNVAASRRWKRQEMDPPTEPPERSANLLVP